MPDLARSDLTCLVRHPGGNVEALPAHRVDEIDRFLAAEDTLIWVSATAPSEDAIDVLRREFDLHPLAVEDVRKQGQRPNWMSIPGST